MFKKVWQGSVQLLQLAGSDMPLRVEVLPHLDLQQLLTRGLPFTAHALWDIAAAVAAVEQGEVVEGRSSVLALVQVLRLLFGCPGPAGMVPSGKAHQNPLQRMPLSCLVCIQRERPVNTQ